MVKVWSIQLDGTFDDGTLGRIHASRVDQDPVADARTDELRDELSEALTAAARGLSRAGYEVEGLGFRIEGLA